MWKGGRRTNRGFWALAVVGVIAPLVLQAHSGVADGSASAGTWQGTVTLSTYPCPVVSCRGSLSGTLAGTAVGLDPNGHPFVVIWPDPTSLGSATAANLSASFLYSDACPVGASGSGSGGFSLTGGYVDHAGVVSHDGTLTGGFGELRVGAVLLVSTSSGVLTGGGQTLATQQTIGEGAGVFVPTAVASCFNVATISARVAGSFGSPR